MPVLRRLSACLSLICVVAANVVLGLAAAPSALAASQGYTYCPYGSYTQKSALVSASQRPRVTHMSTFSAGPKYSRTVSRTVLKQLVLTGSVRLNAEVSAKLGNKILGQGEQKLGLELAASGQHTSSTTEQVTETVRNPTNHNVTMVFFRGNQQAYGSWKRSSCKQVSGLIGQVVWNTGSWTSYARYGDGYVLCGSGTKNLNSLAKAAYAKGCR